MTLSDNQLKDKLEKYYRPANCEKLTMPQVNPEVWGKLSRLAKGNDLRFFLPHTNVTKVGRILPTSTDFLLKTKSDSSKFNLEDLVRISTDAPAYLGHVSFEIPERRRDSIRLNLNKDYVTLCSPNVPVAAFPFGDEFETELNLIRASNKIGYTASR